MSDSYIKLEILDGDDRVVSLEYIANNIASIQAATDSIKATIFATDRYVYIGDWIDRIVINKYLYGLEEYFNTITKEPTIYSLSSNRFTVNTVINRS